MNPNIKAQWNEYYERAEDTAKSDFDQYLKPIWEGVDIRYNAVLDFACGRGRMSEVLLKDKKNKVHKLTLCDTNKEALDFAVSRLKKYKAKIETVVNNADGQLLALPIKLTEDGGFTFIFSWDAMVHFSYEWMDFYMAEFSRLMCDNAIAVIHHSNFKSENIIAETKHLEWSKNPHGRAYFSSDDMVTIAKKCELKILGQNIIDWDESKDLDCISVLKK